MNIFSNETLNQIARIKEQYQTKKIGFTCSCFDLLHTGHLIMLEDAKQQCDILIVGLQTDPTIDRPETKNTPIQSFFEREKMINAIKHIDEVIIYATESDLNEILLHLRPDVRIIGSDWKGKNFTGHNHEFIPIHWHERTHTYSSSNLRDKVFKLESEKRKKNNF